MTGEQSAVQRFHWTMCIPVGDYAAPAIARQALRVRLLREEVDELERATTVEQYAHELADILYVAYGAAVEAGIDLEHVFAAVHDANMTKRRGEERADGKLLKGPDYRPPDIAAVLRQRRIGEDR